MINKLKRKFIILTTVSTLVLMTIMVGIMNIINYSVVVKESDATIDLLLRSDFHMPDGKNLPGKEHDDDKNFVPHGMSPEVPYESRFFWVTVDEDGNTVKSDFSKILSVDKTSAAEYVEKALSKNSDRGFIGSFRYAKKYDEKQTTIVFLDCGRKLDSFKAFLFTSCCVGLGGCIIVFIAFILLAGRIVKPIAESYEKQKRFISDAGHEMKTPLTIINANLDLIESDENKEELDDIRIQTKRMTDLTNSLVYLSKIEESEHKMKMVEMPLSDIVSEVANQFQALTDWKKIKFSANIAKQITFYGSPDAIRQLISILLDNAVKYSPVEGLISIDLLSGKKNISVAVRNTTDFEVDRSSLHYVFERFYRSDSSRNSETGGHGIGLSIAKAIVTAHGGSIAASTDSGKDFCIAVTFPI